MIVSFSLICLAMPVWPSVVTTEIVKSSFALFNNWMKFSLSAAGEDDALTHSNVLEWVARPVSYTKIITKI